MTLPRDLEGTFYLLVNTNHNRTVNESGHTANNTGATVHPLQISLSPAPDLSVTAVNGPGALQPGQAATISYRTVNLGDAPANGPWRDRIFLDRGAAGLLELASVLRTGSVATGASVDHTLTVQLPLTLPDGEYRWVVRVDADNSVYERTGEGNNQASAADVVRVFRPDCRSRRCARLRYRSPAPK